MTITPERYLLAARLKRRVRRAPEMIACRICGRMYVPHLQQLGCSNTCCDVALKKKAAR